MFENMFENALNQVFNRAEMLLLEKLVINVYFIVNKFTLQKYRLFDVVCQLPRLILVQIYWAVKFVQKISSRVRTFSNIHQNILMSIFQTYFGRLKNVGPRNQRGCFFLNIQIFQKTFETPKSKYSKYLKYLNLFKHFENQPHTSKHNLGVRGCFQHPPLH